MTFERNPGPPPEPAPVPAPQAGREPTPVQIRLQILSTEHWSLLASRSLAWNEVFSRAGMYLSTLSGAMIALGLIVGADGFHAPFFVFALVVLPIVLFVGIGTWLRMGASNYHEAISVAGMNRIRGAYLEIAPDLEPYFVMSRHDDPRGVGVTMALPPGTPFGVFLISSTPFLIMVLNSVVAGAIFALVAMHLLGSGPGITLATGLVGAAIMMGLEFLVATRNIRRGQGALTPMFPTPGTGERPDD